MMPNAKDITEDEVGKPKFLLVGSTGSGKTSQICTLPGKTFAYLFDPSALATLRGQDIEYDEFVAGRLNLGAVSLSKGKSDPRTKTDAPDIYTAWEKDFTKKTEDKFWDKIDNIAFDSFTTFSDIVMDRILALNGRTGQFPQQDDWGGQMQTITNVVRTLTAMNKTLIFTAHDEYKQDEGTSRMQNVIILTGRLRTKIPLLFSDIWHMESASTASEIKYQAQTRPDRMNPAIRCTFRELEMYEDVTIKDWSKPQNYGIGKLLKGRK
jgi:hypothetical protein